MTEMQAVNTMTECSSQLWSYKEYFRVNLRMSLLSQSPLKGDWNRCDVIDLAPIVVRQRNGASWQGCTCHAGVRMAIGPALGWG